MPIPVAATGSRARKPSTEASSCSGTVAATAMSAGDPALGRARTQPSCTALNTVVASDQGEEAERQRRGRPAAAPRGSLRRRACHQLASTCGEDSLSFALAQRDTRSVCGWQRSARSSSSVFFAPCAPCASSSQSSDVPDASR